MRFPVHARVCKAIALAALALAILLLTITSGALAQTETIIHSFTGECDGGEPIGGLISDANGNLYGVTEVGGANFAGSVFELTPSSNGTWTETVIFSFSFEGNGGVIPGASVVFDKQGNLYGEAEGGANGSGVIFELSPGANGVWTETVLYNFTGGTDGSSGFLSGLAIDAAGNLYGTTQSGGTYNFGTAFVLIHGSNGTWTKKILHNFSQNNDGGLPYAENLTLDSAGNVYGTTLNGGAYDYGVVFELVRGSNGSFSEKVLHSFTGGDGGSGAEGGLTFDASGNLYGCTANTVYQLVPTASGEWTIKILHEFMGGSDGADAGSAVTFDKAGDLYGNTDNGGRHRGTVFELIPHDGTWTEKILHRFAESGNDGTFPFFSQLVIDSHGNLYGTAAGGASGEGVVYEVTP